MYLYVSFFNERSIFEGEHYFIGSIFNQIKQAFPNYLELNEAVIDGCIGLLKGKNYAQNNCFSLIINDIRVDDDRIAIKYEIDKELDLTNDFINKSLYKVAWQSNWINSEINYIPSICIVEKKDFDNIRKGTSYTRKMSSHTAKLDEMRSNNDWHGICDLCEPLEEISHNNEIWNNVNDLYNIAFACSKLGEPKNGLEKDKEHLFVVKRYRDLSILFYKRCCEINPNDFRYPSAVAYRYYANVTELTKPKGRRDGKVVEEINMAIKWLDEALGLNPNSIKDNYRKGKLVIDKQIPHFRSNNKEWTRDTYNELAHMEKTGVACLERSINLYEELTTEKWIDINRNEYIKAIYCLGCYYIDKPKNTWNEYVCKKLIQDNFIDSMTREEMEYIVRAKNLFEKCFYIEANIEPSIELDAKEVAMKSKKWTISAMDILYRLGLVYLNMFFIKHVFQSNEESTSVYGEYAESYLTMAIDIGEEYRRMNYSRRETSHIKEKLAWYYIFMEDYNKGIKSIEQTRDSYIKNTYSIALMLSDLPDKYDRAEKVLNSAESDPYNKAVGLTKSLKVYLYKLSEQGDKYSSFLSNNKDKLNKSSKYLISLLEEGALNEN